VTDRAHRLRENGRYQTAPPASYPEGVAARLAARLACAFQGHRWKTVEDAAGTFAECTRCAAIGHESPGAPARSARAMGGVYLVQRPKSDRGSRKDS
jgi:hypothetical protein